MLSKVVSSLRTRATESRSRVVSLLATAVDYGLFSIRLSLAPKQLVEDKLGAGYQTQLEENGICIVENFWDANTCAAARAEVDRVIEQYPEYLHAHTKSDLRIFGANNVSSIIDEFARHPTLQAIASVYNRASTCAAFTLAAKMPYSNSNKGSGEGWHRDAFFRQFKAIMYLTDVELNNGPFQFLRDSHKRGQVLRDIWTGKLRYSQNRLSDSEVELILHSSPSRLQTYTAKAGTLILVDTSSIHRGIPIKEGCRYALTNYYYPENAIDNAMMEKFHVLQKY